MYLKIIKKKKRKAKKVYAFEDLWVWIEIKLKQSSQSSVTPSFLYLPIEPVDIAHTRGKFSTGL